MSEDDDQVRNPLVAVGSKALAVRSGSLVRRGLALAGSLRSKGADAHNEAGLALQGKGDIDGATAEYATAIRIQPDNPAAHFNLGAVLYCKDDLDGAIEEFSTAIRLKPDYAAAHNNLGAVLYRKGDMGSAISAYREAIRLDPSFRIAHDNLGYALNREGELDAAATEYREAARLSPKGVCAGSRPGAPLGSNADSDGTIEEGRAAWHTEAGDTPYAKFDLDGAIAEYLEALRLNPSDANTHNNLGLTLEEKGDLCLPEALDEYRAAHVLDPGNPLYKQNYERLLRKMNE